MKPVSATTYFVVMGAGMGAITGGLMGGLQFVPALVGAAMGCAFGWGAGSACDEQNRRDDQGLEVLSILAELKGQGVEYCTTVELFHQLEARGAKWALIPVLHERCLWLKGQGWVQAYHREGGADRGYRPELLYGLTANGLSKLAHHCNAQEVEDLARSNRPIASGGA